jgi:MoxR-like ATPase
LGTLSQEAKVDIEVTRYQMNIVSFLRMHRAVAGGISPTATKHFGQLMRCLAALHRLDFVTPALVGLAAHKIYLHRIQLTLPEKERSMQWGSKVEAVEALLEDIGPEDVVEDVLGMVTAPL